MKNKDKHYLKALLLASISSIGMPVAQATGMSAYAARKEHEGSDANTEMISETLTSGVLESHPSYGEVLGHTSHGSHGSHGSHSSHTSSSHASHSSHTSSSGYGGGSSGESTGTALAALGGLAGTIVLTYLVNHIIKSHSKHVAARKAEINKNRAFGCRDLSSGIYGTDVDRLTDLLIENNALDRFDRTYSHKWSHYKYNGKVKRSVKRMQARMGRQRTGKASTLFQMNLQQWKDKKNRLMSSVSRDSLDLMENRNALLAVAILLVEKGYLNSYDADDIMSEHEKSKIIKAYYSFLRRKQLSKTTLVDEQRLRLLDSSRKKQK